MAAPIKISPKHRLMALDMALGKMSNNEIAEKYGLNPTGVSLIKSVPLFKLLVDEISADIRERAVQQTADLAGRFDAESPKAAEKLFWLRDNAERQELQRLASIDILDRAPNAPKVRKIVEQETSGIIIQISGDAFLGMREAAREAGTVINLPATDYRVKEAARAVRMVKGEDGFEFDDFVGE